jgi:radical SAM protein with 4Fe4S-binding SPASM domain
MSRAQQALDLDVSLFEKLLEETRQVGARLYLWGGEPLFHRQISRILELIDQEKRDTVICTNGVYVSKYQDQLCRISDRLELLIAVEGFEAEHDRLRGKGSFKDVMTQIENLLRLRADGQYKGKISIHTVINDRMIGRLYELMEFLEAKAVDLVLLTFPWFISEQTSRHMDRFVSEHLDWLVQPDARKHSWDAFKYCVGPQNVGLLMSDLERINRRVWTSAIRYQPDLDFDEIEQFVRGDPMTARCAQTCHVLNSRVDITPDGTVSACKFFSEFAVGNLNDKRLSDMWRSGAYERLREVLGKQLSPACSKCSVLYLHAHSTPLHF